MTVDTSREKVPGSGRKVGAWTPYQGTSTMPAKPKSADDLAKGYTMDLVDACRVRGAVEHAAVVARLTSAEFAMLLTVLHYTAGWRRTVWTVKHTFIADFAQVHPDNVGRTLRGLAAKGFLLYAAGSPGRTAGGYSQTHSTITLVVPEGWQRGSVRISQTAVEETACPGDSHRDGDSHRGRSRWKSPAQVPLTSTGSGPGDSHPTSLINKDWINEGPINEDQPVVTSVCLVTSVGGQVGDDAHADDDRIAAAEIVEAEVVDETKTAQDEERSQPDPFFASLSAYGLTLQPRPAVDEAAALVEEFTTFIQASRKEAGRGNLPLTRARREALAVQVEHLLEPAARQDRGFIWACLTGWAVETAGTGREGFVVTVMPEFVEKQVSVGGEPADVGGWFHLGARALREFKRVVAERKMTPAERKGARQTTAVADAEALRADARRRGIPASELRWLIDTGKPLPAYVDQPA